MLEQSLKVVVKFYKNTVIFDLSYEELETLGRKAWKDEKWKIFSDGSNKKHERKNSFRNRNRPEVFKSVSQKNIFSDTSLSKKRYITIQFLKVIKNKLDSIKITV